MSHPSHPSEDASASPFPPGTLHAILVESDQNFATAVAFSAEALPAAIERVCRLRMERDIARTGIEDITEGGPARIEEMVLETIAENCVGRLLRVQVRDRDEAEAVTRLLCGRDAEGARELVDIALALRTDPPAPFTFATLLGEHAAVARTIEEVSAAVRREMAMELDDDEEPVTPEDIEKSVARALADGVPVLITAADEVTAFAAWRKVAPVWSLDQWREAFPAPEGADPLVAVVERVEAEFAAEIEAFRAREAQRAADQQAQAAERAAAAETQKAEAEARRAAESAQDLLDYPLPADLPPRYAGARNGMHLAWKMYHDICEKRPSVEVFGRIARFVDAEISGRSGFPMKVYVVCDHTTGGRTPIGRTPEEAAERLEAWIRDSYPTSDGSCTEAEFVALGVSCRPIVPVVVERPADGPRILGAMMRIGELEAARTWSELMAGNEPAPGRVAEPAFTAEQTATEAETLLHDYFRCGEGQRRELASFAHDLAAGKAGADTDTDTDTDADLLTDFDLDDDGDAMGAK